VSCTFEEVCYCVGLEEEQFVYLYEAEVVPLVVDVLEANQSVNCFVCALTLEF